ncbi:methyltransferase domain-containing protein [Psychroserpens luteolus]|uniref:methyltransferase domain-containing protein n=1 Tax=Psychroserpens luteolus TaxID=2855840 RepID=UPI001E31E56E|nr:methyltransferase domain-containing protein [Psychroserpens luteolus]MCD2259632.1 class I SAM-dependent methyltransferase [Psychroserpens luteolus]
MLDKYKSLTKGYLKGRIRATAKFFINNSALARSILINKEYAASKSEYCYNIWMQHFGNWRKLNDSVPDVVIEIGSGNSLGVGLSALLSGASKFYALEKTQFWNDSTNLRIFDELVERFQKQINSNNREENSIGHLLTIEHLETCLEKDRIEKIRNELEHPHDPNNTFVRSIIPWSDKKHIEDHTVDLICSHTVLQHINDLDFMYEKMNRWLKKDGCISHTIDLRSLNTSKLWNGHWTYSVKEWKIVTGGINLINREPISTHLNLLKKYNFEIRFKKITTMKNKLLRSELAERYRDLKEIDLTSSGLYYFAQVN